MAFLTPGVHENLTFGAGSKINEQGTLVLEMKTGEVDVMAALEGNDTLEDAGSNFMFFPPSVSSFEGVAYKPIEIVKVLTKNRSLLLKYASLLGPKADAEAAFGGLKMFEGLGITKEQIPELVERLTDENVLKKVSTNLQTKFLQYVQSLPNFSTTTFRHKFWRKNAKESFAVIPNSFDEFVEPMSIPKDASKISWNEWELKNKKNDASNAPADNVTEEPKDTQSLFETEDKATDETANLATGPATDIVEGSGQNIGSLI